MKKKAQDIKDFFDIEFAMKVNLDRMVYGFDSEEEKLSLVELEPRKKTILCDREKEARQKSRALWLLCGDDNTPFFHKYATHRKNLNSIWKIEDDNGNLVEVFEAIARAGVHHFESLFQEEANINLPEIVQSVGYFPTSISVDDNCDLMKPITLQDIQFILYSSKNDKILGPNGIPVEVYRCLFDVLGEDLLRVIELSRISGKIPAVFNSTFISLIPNNDHPISFEYFRPISLGNYTYNILRKIISIQIRKVLGRCIFGE